MITSITNQKIKNLIKLCQKSAERRAQNVFLVEGEIAEALVGLRSLPPDEAGMVLVPLEIDGIPQGDEAGGKGRRG